MYIGRSNNLRTRFVAHVNGNFDTTKNFCLSFRGLDFWYSVMENENIQRDLEANMIALMGPPVNKVQPKLNPIVGILGSKTNIVFPD